MTDKRLVASPHRGVARRRGRPPAVAPLLEPLDRGNQDPVERQVYEVIRRALMSGAILPGTKLSSRSIAAALNVSSMPVREALKRLDADGVLHSVAKSAYVIHELTVAEYREILDVRLRLEGMLVRRGATALSGSEIASVRALLNGMLTATDFRDVLAKNFQLHFIIYRAARMPFTEAIVENIWLRLGPALHLVSQAVSVNRAVEHLQPLVEAVARGDADAAEQSCLADILANAALLMDRLEDP